MSANIVARTEGYYIEYIYQGKVVDRAGPFDDLEDAEAAVERAEYE